MKSGNWKEEFAGVVARAVVEPSRDIESLRGRLEILVPPAYTDR